MLSHTTAKMDGELSECKTCENATKYHYLNCADLVCNCRIDCSIFVSGSYSGWTAGKCVALCKARVVIYTEPGDRVNVDKVVILSLDNDSRSDSYNNSGTESEGGNEFVIDCSSRGFHKYRRI